MKILLTTFLVMSSLTFSAAFADSPNETRKEKITAIMAAIYGHDEVIESISKAGGDLFLVKIKQSDCLRSEYYSVVPNPRQARPAFVAKYVDQESNPVCR